MSKSLYPKKLTSDQDDSDQYDFIGLDGKLHLSLNKRAMKEPHKLEPMNMNELEPYNLEAMDMMDMSKLGLLLGPMLDSYSGRMSISDINKLGPQLAYSLGRMSISDMRELGPLLGRSSDQVDELLGKRTYRAAVLEIGRVLGLVLCGILRPSDSKLYVVNESINALYIGMTTPETSGDSVVIKPLIYDVFSAMNTWFPGPCPGYPDPFPR